MISYDRFFKLLDRRGINPYSFANQIGLSGTIIGRMQHNQHMNTTTLDKLCNHLNCEPSEILSFKRDDGGMVPDHELFFLLEFARTADFERSASSNACQKLKTLYQAYCIHNNIDDANIFKKQTYVLLTAIFQEGKKNKTFPFTRAAFEAWIRGIQKTF